MVKRGKKASIGKHTFTMWSTSIIAAIASYIFYFSMARILSPEDYGLLYSLIAMTYIFSVPTETIRFVVSRYVTIFNAKNSFGVIRNLVLRSAKKILLYSLIGLAFVLIITPLWLSGFLHAPVWPILIVSLSIPFLFLLPIFHGTLQGLQRFVALGINNSLEMIIKLIIAVCLALVGLKVYGPILAIPLSLLFSITLCLVPLKDIFKKKDKKIGDISGIYKYFFPFLFVILFLTVMSSVDVLIAKHYFSPSYAGFYAAISTLGTALFFISIGVTKVMFPMVIEKHQQKKHKEHTEILYRSLFLVAIPSTLMVLAFILFPKTIVGLILGAKYLPISDFVKYEAIAMGFLALSNVLSLYNLAIEKKRFIFLPAIFCALEIAMLSMFHGSLDQYLKILVLVNVLLFVFLLISSVNMNEFLKRIYTAVKRMPTETKKASKKIFSTENIKNKENA